MLNPLFYKRGKAPARTTQIDVLSRQVRLDPVGRVSKQSRGEVPFWSFPLLLPLPSSAVSQVLPLVGDEGGLGQSQWLSTAGEHSNRGRGKEGSIMMVMMMTKESYDDDIR